MTETSAPASTGEASSGLPPWVPTLQLGKIATDFVREVAYQHGRFVGRSYVVTMHPGPWEPLSSAAMEELRIELERDVKSDGQSVDAPALRVFIELLGDAIDGDS
jgi:hypothetical protein